MKSILLSQMLSGKNGAQELVLERNNLVLHLRYWPEPFFMYQGNLPLDFLYFAILSTAIVCSVGVCVTLSSQV